MKHSVLTCAFCIALAVNLIASTVPSYAVGAPMMTTKEFTVLNVEIEGSKIWLPGVLVLKRGEEVKLKLVNKHKDPHGYAVDELRLQAVVDGASTKDVVIKPAGAGTFRLYCHLHPAHIGGQVIVNP